MPGLEVTVDQNADTCPFPILQEAGSYRPALCSERRRKHVCSQAVAVVAAFNLSGHQISGPLFLLHLSPRETAQSPMWSLYSTPSPGSLNERKSFIGSKCGSL